MKFGEQVVKYRYIILIVFVVLFVLACVLLPRMIKSVNYDISSYLPADYSTTQGYNFLSKNFGIHGDVEIGIRTTEIEKLRNSVAEMRKVTGVSMLIWEEDVDSIVDFGLMEETDAQYQKMHSLFTDGTNHLILVTLDHGPSSKEALASYNGIADILNRDFGKGNYFSSGMTGQAADLFENTINEFWKYALIAVAFVIVILILTTNSVTEPFVLLLTILISILLNLGSNALFNSTSIVTFACSAILQLGLTMDYAIFLLHQYRLELQKTPDPKVALSRAIPTSTKAILSSALTTVGGLLALMVMKFGVGPDLGLTVSKGIILSFLTVILLQPCLMLMLEKARVKTTHKCLDYHFKSPVKGSIKHRWIIALLFIPVFIVSLLVNVDSMPWSLKYTYVHFTKEKEVAEEFKTVQKMSNDMGQQVMIAVPLYKKETDTEGNEVYTYYIAEQYKLLEKLDSLQERDDTSFSLGLFAMLDKDKTYNLFGLSLSAEDLIKVLIYLRENNVDPNNPDDLGDLVIFMIDNNMISLSLDELIDLMNNTDLSNLDMSQGDMINSYLSNGYTIYTVGINTKYDVESKEAFAILDEIRATMNDLFGNYGQTYMTGFTQGAYDFAQITPTDNMWVSIISVIVIFVILLFTLRSLKFSTVLVALIECGIWLNLLTQWIFYSGTINFMCYIFIGAVQLGATVDYAILISTKYKEFRKRFEPRQASYMATTQSSIAITTSALIMGAACASVAMVTSNTIVQQLCTLIARGSLISAVLVIFVLPALLVVIDRTKGHEIHFERTPNLRKFKFKKKT